ncbi:hypothetical protein FACS189418_2820 [Clostridia bacterium]|nr:hypothetical protein FACS189418_2820 [Clostridia bacterium]
MKIVSKFLWGLIFFLFVCLNVLLFHYFLNYSEYYQLHMTTNEQEDFRSMNFGKYGLAGTKRYAIENQLDFFDVLTTYMVKENFDLQKTKETSVDKLPYLKLHQELIETKKDSFLLLKASYQAILEDLVYFPIPKSERKNDLDVDYSNSWNDVRTYGGERRHEGTDIMARINQRGIYPVLSMSNGIVEKVGWLEQGGWRIGIRTPSGAYLYYAHLYNYARDWKVGDTVLAGEFLGFMGDSGYGKTEGTVGNFAVHLHLGIYIATQNHQEISVNPYWILKSLEDSTLSYNDEMFRK